MTNGDVAKCRAFVETVRCGGFTRAADILGCSQSGVSRMIADLEREWDVRLVERGRGGVTLTPDGEALIGFAAELCASHDRLTNRVDEIHGLATGSIRIGTFSSVATHWLPGVISRFRIDHPDARYEMLLGDYTEIETWIREGRVDFGFLRMREGLDLETEPIARDELMAVLPEGHPLASCDRVPLAELAREPFMLLEKGARAEISELFERNGLTPDVRFTTWDDYAVMSMVESGLGVSILPELILRRVPYRVCVRHLDVPAYRDICVAMRSRELLPTAARRFLGYMDRRLVREGTTDTGRDSERVSKSEWSP